MAVRNGFDVAYFTINIFSGYSDAATRSLSSKLIEGYQKYISPRKGFSCAYRILHVRESCSQYAKRQIIEQGLINAMPLIRQRFQACNSANRVIRAKIQQVSYRRQEESCGSICGDAPMCCLYLTDS